MKTTKNYTIHLIIGMILFAALFSCNEAETPIKVQQKCSHDYQIDVYDDSLWLFDGNRIVDSGRYSQLEEMIIKDNE